MAEAGQVEQPKLTAKQELFVSCYCGPDRFNATRAAISAGYSEKSASRIAFDLKKTPAIRARIDEFLEANTLAATEVLHELTDVAMRGLDEFIEVTRYDKEGNPVAARMDASAKIKSLELLGKHHQLFSDNLNITGGIEVREYVGIPEDQP
jgi:phage terminase small subunit